MRSKFINLQKIVFLLFLGLLSLIKSHAATSDSEHITIETQRIVWKGDLDSMIKRRIVRVLLPYNKTLYFLDKDGQQRGLIYDMMIAFEQDLNQQIAAKNLKVQFIFLPTARDQLIPQLLAGKGDIIAADLTITPGREKLIDFSTPLASGIKEVIVTSTNAASLSSLEDLSGKTVFVNPSTSYAENLKLFNASLQKQKKNPVVIKDAPGTFETEDILEMVNANLVSITVSDLYLARFWKNIFPNIQIHDNLALHKDGNIALRNIKLLNLFSSKMSAAEFSFAGAALTKCSRHRSWRPYWMQLGGTPLNEAIISAMEIIPKFQKDYKLQIEKGSDPKILTLLERVKAEQDTSLSFRRSCREGVCGSDGMNLNGTRISTDCEARVTVTGGTDRVFISGQLDQYISY